MNEQDIVWCKTLLGMLVASYDSKESGHDLAKQLLNSAEFQAAVKSVYSRYRIDPSTIKLNVVETKNHLETDEPFLELIVLGKEQSKKEFRNLRSWLKNAKTVTIVDPYILHSPSNSKLFESSEMYCDYLVDLISPETKKLTLVGNGYTNDIKQKLRSKLKEGREIKFVDTNSIHDRYLIRDSSQGKMIGTSLGGFGNKMFTILDLPAKDVSTICEFIHKININ
jgi:hypothetical protein